MSEKTPAEIDECHRRIIWAKAEAILNWATFAISHTGKMSLEYDGLISEYLAEISRALAELKTVLSSLDQLSGPDLWITAESRVSKVFRAIGMIRRKAGEKIPWNDEDHRRIRKLLEERDRMLALMPKIPRADDDDDQNPNIWRLRPAVA